MQLKRYQERTLGVIKNFFEKTQSMTPAAAYQLVTEDLDVQARLGKLRKYVEVDGNVPKVAVKVPTGGGKTIIAVEAIRVIGEAFGIDYPFVLWFTPSDAITRQTVEALKRTTHPYRQELERVFGNNVRVYGIDEKFTITPSDLDGNVVIVVTTAQAFVHEKKEKYNVYRKNENLADSGHFDGVVLEDGMECDPDDPTKPLASFANLIVKEHPLMIVDEAHKFMARLSKETLEGLRPRGVLELSATPTLENNLLYCVKASELYDEQMVKLPIEVKPCSNGSWDQAVLAAIAKRNELAKVADEAYAAGDGAYLRPIVLFQASKVNGETPVEELKKFLIDTAKVPADEIAVVTGEQKELDGVDVNAPDCRIKYVITVQALKEGWDCPSAYVLCSVASIHSNTDTIQLLGRVMRQPQAKRRERTELNRAYAFVVSSSFNEAAEDLVSGLKDRGFDDDIARAAVLIKQYEDNNATDDLPLFQGALANKVVLSGAEAESVKDTLPQGVTVEETSDGGVEIKVDPNASAAVHRATVAALTNAGLNEKAQEFAAKVQKGKTRQNESSPSATGGTFRLPKICGLAQDELVFDADEAYGALNVDLMKFLPAVLSSSDFALGNEGNSGFEVNINGEKIAWSVKANAAQIHLPGFSGVLDESAIVNALDALPLEPIIPQAKKRGWITGIVHELVNARGYSCDRLYCCRYHLNRVLQSKMDEAHKSAVKEAYQSVFGFVESNENIKLVFEDQFVFDKDIYKNELAMMKFYGGGDYVFTKHFLGPNRIPQFDGQKANGEGEEYECAKRIDQHPNVKYWLRNAALKTGSFRLPVSNGWFYPDFIGSLEDGRLFVVEYKGADRKSNADTIEKDAIGRLWASKSNGKCLYRTVYKEDAGKDVVQQLNELFA